MKTIPAPSLADLGRLPVTTSLSQAAAFFGAGRDAAYDIHRRGEFPCEVLRVGGRLVVTKAALCAALGVTVLDAERAARALDGEASDDVDPSER